jgi:type IV pilus assembly protein PilC
MEFVCRLGTPEGRVMEKVLQAPDEEALRSDLEKQGVHVFHVRRRGVPEGITLPTLRRRRKGLDTQQFLLFNQELAALLRAGLPLLQALELMLERMENEQFRSVLTDIRDRVSSGEDLSDAFAVHGDMFPRLYPASLKAGERSGELEQVIRRFIRYQKLVLDARKRAISALIYPAILISLSIVMLLVLTVYVVPSFTRFYEGLDAELPLLTRIVVGISVFLRGSGWIFGVLLVAAVFALRRWARTPAGRLAVDGFKLRLPLLGNVAHLFALSEFCRSLATLLSGGIPLVQALDIATEAVGNASVRGAIEPEIRRVREGESFHEAIEKSGVFPSMAVDMAKVGEATGALDEMLSNISDFFDEKVELQLQRILALVEPAMLVFMGVVVAMILLSLYLPMFGALGRMG